MTTLGVLKSRIADDIARSDLTTQIATAISNAVRHYERERFWFNEATASLVTAASTQTVALPSDFMAADNVRVTVNGSTYDLIQRTKAYIDALTTTPTHVGQPSDWTIFANLLWLWPIPDAIYTLPMPYQKALAALSDADSTNAWTVEAEDLIRNRAESEIYSAVIRDQEMASLTRGWEMDALNNLKAHTGRVTSSGGIVPYSW